MKTTLGMILAGAVILAGSHAVLGKQESGRADAVRKLDGLKVSVDFHDLKLAEAIDYLRDVTGVNFVVSPRSMDKAPDQTVRLKVRDLSVRSILKLMLHPRELTATYRDGAVLIVPREDIQQAVTLQMYDVRAQMLKLPDFPGPKVELTDPAKGMGPGVVVTLDDPKEPPIDADLLVQLVKENTGGRSWEENPHTSISLANGILVVTQSAPVHREIVRFLGLLEQYK